MAGYFSKFASISKWRLSSVAGARANKQIRTKIGGIILVPDNATDTSLFCLPVQASGADAFKLALNLISCWLQEVDARIVNTLHNEIIEARDEKAFQNDVCPIKPGGFRGKRKNPNTFLLCSSRLMNLAPMRSLRML